MYLRVTRGRFDPEHHEELLRLAEEVTTALRRLPGCRGAQFGLDRGGGRLAAVSTWDTAGHAGFSRETLGRLAARLQALGVQLDPPEIYELVPPS
jgi:quinol monooxygenase YgiN